MYRFESWTIKKTKYWRTDAFELWCWRLLRVPWIARRSNQSILKEISPEYLLEALILKLKLQYFGHLMQRSDSLEKTLIEDWRQEEKGMTEDKMVGWHHQLNEHEFEQALGIGDGQGSLVCYSSWGPKESDTTEQLNWKDCHSPTWNSPVWENVGMSEVPWNKVDSWTAAWTSFQMATISHCKS